MKRNALPAMFRAMALSGAAVLLFGWPAYSQGSQPAQAPPDSAEKSSVQTGAGGGHIHKITVKFDYDFTRTPSCAPPKVKDKCIAQFNVYDISAGVKNKSKLFSVPAPAGETKRVTGISATSPSRNFEPGRHLIGVAGVEPNGTESDPRGSTVWVDIP